MNIFYIQCWSSVYISCSLRFRWSFFFWKKKTIIIIYKLGCFRSTSQRAAKSSSASRMGKLEAINFMKIRDKAVRMKMFCCSKFYWYIQYFVLQTWSVNHKVNITCTYLANNVRFCNNSSSVFFLHYRF